MNTINRIFLYFLLLGSLLAACSVQPPVVEGENSPDSAVADLEGFLSILEESGSSVDTGGEILQPFFEPPGQVVVVEGFELQVFEFADEAAAAAAAGTISADGTSIGTTMLAWIEPPHFFRSGKIVVLYLGGEAKALSLLEAHLGPQIAGG